MRTGRPRSFCTDNALDRATDVFWRKGYEGASLSDLTTAMGINPPSLYAAFGSKEGLFNAVLDRYEMNRQGFLSEVIAQPTARAAAEMFLNGVAEKSGECGDHPPGCLLVQGGLSCGDSAIPEELARHRATPELALRERFECARSSGDLPKTANPAALARYLIAVANGISVQAGAGAGTSELREVANLALAAWPTKETKKKSVGRSITRSAKKPDRVSHTASE